MRGAAWAVMVLAGLGFGGAALSGCAAPEAASPEATEPVDVECPDELVDPTPVEHGLGTTTVASSAPSLGPASQAWLCTYVNVATALESEAGGSTYGWSLAEGPVEVASAQLGEVDALLAALAPAPEDRACTADLGPRHMLVAVVGGAPVGTVVDDYGCRDVRLTDDPWTVAPGESLAAGIPAGVLAGPEGMVATLESLAG